MVFILPFLLPPNSFHVLPTSQTYGFIFFNHNNYMCMSINMYMNIACYDPSL